jgi:hypothetical protein
MRRQAMFKQGADSYISRMRAVTRVEGRRESAMNAQFERGHASREARGVRNCIAAAATASLLLATGCTRQAPVALPAAIAIAPGDGDWQAVNFTRHAMNAMVVPLIDDVEPLRWISEPLAVDECADGFNDVTVDGRPFPAGEPLPAIAFKVRRTLKGCNPWGGPWPVLTGVIELTVFHDDGGLSAVVQPIGLRIQSPGGAQLLSAPFAATMSIANSAVRP